MTQTHRFAALWLGALMLLPPSALQPLLGTPPSTPERAALGEAGTRPALRDIVGSSGNLRALIGMPIALAKFLTLHSLISSAPFSVPGIHSLGLLAADGDSLVVVTLRSFTAMTGARMNGYHVGNWPKQRKTAGDARYANPAGFIAVTQENAFTPVSKRFRLNDFLTHDQQAVWPKVLVLQPVVLDKLELVGDKLESAGLPSTLHIMSGFRTPQYNAQGVGAKGGRATESRHMFGDAADVIVDADGDGRMDDLDGDGRITIRDARVLFAVAETVELEHPALVGGLSAYPATSAHGPFVHIDARGVRARW